MPATLEDVAAMCAALPEVEEGASWGNRAWTVRGKVFAWERGYSKADLKRFGDEVPPTPPLLGVRTADLHDKEAWLAAGHKGVFTIPHFDGYPAFLIHLKSVGKRQLREAILDAWTAMAPRTLTRDG
jgi:hypothetical protein